MTINETLDTLEEINNKLEELTQIPYATLSGIRSNIEEIISTLEESLEEYGDEPEKEDEDFDEEPDELDLNY